MKAYDFSYDNKNLSDFGFIIVSFDSKGLETIDGAEITFNTISTHNGLKHYLTSSTYEDCITATIQIAKYSCSTGIQEISSSEFREVSKWLNRRKFLKFKLLDEDHIDLYYMASVVSINKIELDGKLMGLELNFVTNSPHSFKEPKTITINCEEGKEVYGWEKYQTDPEIIKLGYVTSINIDAYPQGKVDADGNIIEGEHTDGYQYVTVGQVYTKFINDTSYEEGFIYPYTEITVNSDGDLRIHNAIENRETYIANCKSGEVITMDYPIIKSSDSSHNIQNDFNWNFFRVANTYENSRNDLTISLPCLIKIKYSPIVKVGL